MKVLVAARVPGTDVHEVIQAHRLYLLELMQQWTRLKEGEARDDLGLALMVDAELFRLDAVVRWLDVAARRACPGGRWPSESCSRSRHRCSRPAARPRRWPRCRWSPRCPAAPRRPRRCTAPPCRASPRAISPAPCTWPPRSCSPGTGSRPARSLEAPTSSPHGQAWQAFRTIASGGTDFAEIAGVGTAVGIVIALGVLAACVGLIRSETAPDLRTLTATGAGTSTRRTITAATAAALGLLGAVLGMALAVLAGLVWAHASLSALFGDVPMADVLLLLLGLPLIAAAGGWLFAGREPPAVARQPIG